MKYPTTLLRTLLVILMLAGVGCRDQAADMVALESAINEYESAWASGDFLKVESFFTDDAQRLHTEPEIWDRAEIRRYFKERAAEAGNSPRAETPTDWKAGREYIEIRIEGDIAYDIFYTDTFKAMHIWERQTDGSWKIKYDMGILNQSPEESVNWQAERAEVGTSRNGATVGFRDSFIDRLLPFIFELRCL
ncbi:MAG: YybH family protein [Opitutaceae bacterium]